MDPNTLLVHNFCNQVAKMYQGVRDLRVFYLFADKRSGTIQERFEADARSFWDYQKLFKV